MSDLGARRAFLKQPRGTVVVVGAGRQGLAAARYLVGCGAQVQVVDDAPAERVQTALQGASVPAECFAGGIHRAVMAAANAVVLSPGVPRAHPEVAAALGAGALVVNEVELGAARYPAALLIGVTGSNGKSTTVSMLGEIARAGRTQPGDERVFVGGNLGTPLLAYEGQAPDIIVLELSSYQLETIESLPLNAAVVTNLSPDHLDRYRDADHYYSTKMRIFGLGDGASSSVCGGDDARAAARCADATLGRAVWHFGASSTGPRSASVEPDGRVTLHGEDNASVHFSPADNPNIIGAHNIANAACAIAVAGAVGWSADRVRRGLQAYGGLAHRMERVAVVDGVTYINDSKATNVDAAVCGVLAVPQRLHLIAGGAGKGASYAPLVAASAGRLCTLFTIGEDAPALAEAFAGSVVVAAQTLAQALNLARAEAKPGDTVLLSPACASFDQFQNFERRGEAFAAHVRAWSSEAS